MKKQIFAIYDKVAGAIATTLLMTDKQEVLLRDLRGSTKLLPTMNDNPGDFEIVHLGEIDLDECVIHAEGKKKVIMTLEDLKNGKFPEV